MKITHKLLLCFWSIILCIWAVSLYTVSTSKKDVERVVVGQDVSLVNEFARKLSHVLYMRIETVQEYTNDVLLQNELEKSHSFLEQHGDMVGYIEGVDQQWRTESPFVADPIFKEISGNILSEELEEKKEYFQRKYGYALYSDFLATNKYGVVAGLTSKSSGYRLDKEEWWQKAKENSQYIWKVVFDENAGIYSMVFAVRVNNEEGDFLGILKVVYDFSEIDQLILDMEDREEHNILGYYLVSKDGTLIHTSAPGFRTFDDVSDEEFFLHATGTKGHHVSKDSTDFFVYVRVPGIREMQEPGWLLIIPHQSEEVFKLVTALQKKLFLFASFATVFVLVVSMLTFQVISKPLLRFKKAVKEIGEGHLDKKVDIDSKDEIGELASAFNVMVENLGTMTVSRDKLVEEVEERLRVEKGLAESEKSLSNIIQSMLTSVIIIDVDSREIVEVNPAALKNLYYSREEVLGKRCNDFFCPTDKGKCPVLDLHQEVDHSERVLVNARGEEVPILKSVTTEIIGGRKCLIESFIDISQRKKAEQEREKLIAELQDALQQIKVLSGIVPICMHCKKIRDDKGYWNQLEKFISDHSEAQFSHSICEACLKEFYPEVCDEEEKS